MTNEHVGALAPPKPAAVGLTLVSPDGRKAEPGYHYDPRFERFPQYAGFIPTQWLQFGEANRQYRIALDEEREAKDAPARRAQLDREAADRAAERERTRPRTVEERLAAIEVRLDRLEAPARLRGRAPTPTRHRNHDDVPPEAA
jgi:hypothetical protein